MSSEQDKKEHNGLYPKVEEFTEQDQNVLYPKVEEFQGTNPPSAPKDQNVLYTNVEEVQGTNPTHGEAEDKATLGEVQGTNTPAEKPKSKKNKKTKAEKVQGSNPPTAADGEGKSKAKWGTHIMGTPSTPSAHPQNQEAATWTARDENENITPNPYLIKGESPQQPSKSPMEAVLQSFNKWAKKAEDLGSNVWTNRSNVWTNLKTGQSVPDAAWGKVSLGAKALTGGGFESLFKQTFPVDADEKLRKTFACYLSTSTGPVAGTLYVSTVKIAFCSDRPLSHTVPSGEQAWTYYRVAIPLVKMQAVNNSANKDNPAQKYIDVQTVDNHEFWFMGFVNYEKAVGILEESVRGFHSPTTDH